MKTLFTLLFLISCATHTPVTKPSPTEVSVPTQTETKPVPTSTPDIPVYVPGTAPDYSEAPKPSPTAVGKFTTDIKTINYNQQQQDKVGLASKYIVLIFRSREYKDAVLNFTYNGTKAFVDNGGMTNEQVYNHLLGGAEALNPILNYQMDVTLKMYYSIRNTVGYGYPTDSIIYTNSKFHNYYSPCQVASNTTHEWTHKMGFEHDSKWNSARDYSVPYGHNTIIENLCPLAEQGKLHALEAEILPLAPTP